MTVLSAIEGGLQAEQAASQLDEMHERDLPSGAIEARQDELQRAALMGELVGGMLHDFNNVLTVITGTIEILAEAVTGRPELAAIARLIEDAASRGAALTSQLLAFARGRPSCPHDVDVNALLVEACRLLRSTLGGQIEIVLMPAGDVPTAWADSGALMAAILSLAIAVRNAMPGGGRFTFQAAARPLRASGGCITAADVVIAMHACGHAIGEHIDRVELNMADGFVRRSGGRIVVLRDACDELRIDILLPETAPLLG
ncbi:histidine kinase dimerization/phospho-acceptor domain-containing protein [Bradyrhizobium sp.]|uniref:histidine kinase dimerization/phospho-acceptor domain-containing protein n=1 Tax=Bradyrhizobium sp. TaxID=376 RepID=UPI003C3C194A